MDSLLSLVENMQEEIGVLDAFCVVRCVMLEAMESAQVPKPKIVQDALIIGREFQSGVASAKQLEQSRVSCWEFADSRSASTDFSDPEVCAVRAAICFLYADPPSEDLPELVNWFFILLEKAGGQVVDPESSLRKCLTTRSGVPKDASGWDRGK